MVINIASDKLHLAPYLYRDLKQLILYYNLYFNIKFTIMNMTVINWNAGSDTVIKSKES